MGHSGVWRCPGGAECSGTAYARARVGCSKYARFGCDRPMPEKWLRQGIGYKLDRPWWETLDGQPWKRSTHISPTGEPTLDISLLIMAEQPDLADEVREHLETSCPGWSMTHVRTPEVAEEAIACQVFDAALVDAVLGEDATRRLLATLRAVQPDCVRLVLASPHRLETTTELVATCHRVLVEPCEPFILCTAVEHARRLRDTLGRTGVRALGLRRRNRESRRPTGDLLSTV